MDTFLLCVLGVPCLLTGTTIFDFLLEAVLGACHVSLQQNDRTGIGAVCLVVLTTRMELLQQSDTQEEHSPGEEKRIK